MAVQLANPLVIEKLDRLSLSSAAPPTRTHGRGSMPFSLNSGGSRVARMPSRP